MSQTKLAYTLRAVIRHPVAVANAHVISTTLAMRAASYITINNTLNLKIQLERKRNYLPFGHSPLVSAKKDDIATIAMM